MREIVTNIYAPDEVACAFVPVLFMATGYDGLQVVLSANNKSITVRQQAYGQSVTMDVREYVQGLFSDWGTVDYSQGAPSSRWLGVGFVLSTLTGQTYTQQATGTFNAVWGALEHGEVWETGHRWKWFKSFPTVIDVVKLEDSNVVVSAGATIRILSEIPEGINHYPLSGFAGKKLISVDNGSWVDTYEVDDCGKGVYLRWLDRCGKLRHWLFEEGTTERVISNDGGYRRNNLRTYDGQGWTGTDGRGEIKTRQDNVTLCATMVDKDTYDLLTDILTSPIVDEWDGENWHGVRVDGGTWARTGAALQDFELRIIRDYEGLQRA